MNSHPKPPSVADADTEKQAMLSVLIFANGQGVVPADISAMSDKTDIIIAADGGARYCSELGILPDIIIGDLDSVPRRTLEDFREKGVTISRHPAKKDETDLELALDYAVKQGSTTARIIGALGGRWDMSLANILLAASTKYNSMAISLHDELCVIMVHHPDKQYLFDDSTHTRISFLPLHGDVEGLTLSGFEYPLTNHRISLGSTQGVSNIIASDRATAHHLAGVLISVQSQQKTDTDHH